MSRECLLQRWQSQVSLPKWPVESQRLWGKTGWELCGHHSLPVLGVFLKMWPHSSSTAHYLQKKPCQSSLGKSKPFTSQAALSPVPHLHSPWTCSFLYSTPRCVYKVASEHSLHSLGLSVIPPPLLPLAPLPNFSSLSHFCTLLHHRPFAHGAPVLGEPPSFPSTFYI